MKSEHALLAVILLAAIMGGGIYFGIKSLSITNQVTGGGSGGSPTITLASAACDPQSTIRPELRIALQNKDNPNVEYIAKTVSVYEGKFDSNNLPTDSAFVDTFTTLTSGLPARASGLAIDCGKTYTVVVPVVSGGAVASVPGTTSDIFTMKVEKNDNVKIDGIANQTYLIGRVYDDEAKGYVYSGDDATAGVWHSSGVNWTSSTGNTTGDNDGLTLGTDGYYRYTLSLETNATETSTARFNDQETTVAIDRQSSTNWDATSGLSFAGVDLIGNKYTVPSKISNLNYDDAYLVPNNPSIKSSVKALAIEQHALNGVNPSDDVKIGVFTAGYYISSKNKDVKYGYAKDNPSSDILYANYYNTTLIFG